MVEIVASCGITLYELVEDLLAQVGPAVYERKDMRLSHPVSKTAITDRLQNEAPPQIGGEAIQEISTLDGVKYILADDSWLLIRTSGTEPVLRVYAEGRSREMLKALMNYGKQVAESVV